MQIVTGALRTALKLIDSDICIQGWVGICIADVLVCPGMEKHCNGNV